MVWLTGMCLAVCLFMIIGLLSMVVYHGSVAFWQPPIQRVELRDGTFFLGAPVRSEAYDASAEERDAVEAMIERGEVERSEALAANGDVRRRLFRVGNRELDGVSFRWAPLHEIESIEEPAYATMLERQEWGVWIGQPLALLRWEMRPLADGEAFEPEGEVETRYGPRRVEREESYDAGQRVVIERVYLTDTAESTVELFDKLHGEAVERREKIKSLKEGRIGHINSVIERARLDLRSVELRHEEGRVSDERLAQANERFEEKRAELESRYAEVLEEIAVIEREDARWRIIVEDPANEAFAPVSQTLRDQPLKLSQIVRFVPANQLGFGGRVGVYLSRWGEFLSDEPREANTEGGVFPVIFSTVLLTILLAIAVVPLGVIAALYLHEYATQGVIVSIVRIAVNNLAGVPSIVYGVFGLGFFCYTVGSFVDGGSPSPWQPGTWFIGLIALGGLIGVAIVATLMGRTRPGANATPNARLFGGISAALWIGAVVAAGLVLFHNPYFDGFFRAKLPQPTFGSKGLLWSSLTLALLTLPVVIVATEEAIAAVPRSMREGSFGCGASKWQTIRRVVLPQAAPGVMTGTILAMARGAGEVAPLMLVGAVKLAPELPFSTDFPFIHVDRTFMHLGFHIYDVGFQSPDSEASRPIAWVTTLLLITIVIILNLTAIHLRATLRRRFVAGAF